FSVRQTLGVLNRHFMLRTCPDAVLNNRSRPCLQYQIKRCLGPCVIDVSKETYAEHVQEAVMFLEGRQPELKERLVGRMMEASGNMEYELAAHYRDQLRAIDSALQSQQMVATHYIDQDVFGLYREGDRLTLQLMYVRRGKLQGTRAFAFKDQEFPDEEVLSSFISQYYLSGNTIPHEVLLPLELESADAMSILLSEERGRKVQVITPQRGAKKKLVETAIVNATHTFRAQQGGEDQLEDLLNKLQKKLKLAHFPERIECFDISNFQGKPIVGSMVVFEGGAPASGEYRHFKVHDVAGQDDFASMYEVLTRRFKRTLQGDWPKPELVVIDGGKGQLSQAVAVLSDLGIHDVDVIALAKSRVERDAQSEEVTRSLERVFLPGRKNPVILRQNSAELFLLQRIRDEAHRSAITFHRRLRRKETLKSSLEEIPGVGTGRRKALIKHFGSVKRVKSATVGELSKVPGISGRLAREIFRFFNSDIALEAED
ncbi:MAG: excinuclease ABC subunit UvrC, partial [Myxococcota bacterium]